MFAISTSGWVRIPAANTDVVTAPLNSEETNDAYVTAELLNSTIYTNDNFWTSVVQGTQSAHLVASATREGKTVGLAISKKVEVKNKVPVEFGQEKVFFQLLPVEDVGTVTVTLTQLKTADDGVNEAVEKLKPALVAVSPSSDAIFSVLGIAKTALDALFMKDLNTNRLDSEKDLTTRLTPGVYVVFASEKKSDYESYKSASDKLYWKNASLTFDGKPVEKLSYYVVSVGMRTARFPSIKAALASSANWSPAYQSVERYIGRVGYGLSDVSSAVLAETFKGAAEQVVNMLKLAGDLLAKDQSLTGYDRLIIQAQLESYFEKQLVARKKKLAGEALPQGTPANIKQEVQKAGEIRTPLLEKLKTQKELQVQLQKRMLLQPGA
jgi:hypothetical protein